MTSRAVQGVSLARFARFGRVWFCCAVPAFAQHSSQFSSSWGGVVAVQSTSVARAPAIDCTSAT
eukprot:8693742-Lingulodinium_polyedra.AAC.1